MSQLDTQTKINAVKTLMGNDEMQVFQQQLFVDAADLGSTGNKVADDGLKGQAENAKAIIAAANQRLAVYSKRLAELEAQLVKEKAAGA